MLRSLLMLKMNYPRSLMSYTSRTALVVSCSRHWVLGAVRPSGLLLLLSRECCGSVRTLFHIFIIFCSFLRTFRDGSAACPQLAALWATRRPISPPEPATSHPRSLKRRVNIALAARRSGSRPPRPRRPTHNAVCNPFPLAAKSRVDASLLASGQARRVARPVTR